MASEIRKAIYTDVPGIAGIYNEAILTTTATFDTEPKTTAAQRKWFKAHGPKNPILVAVEGGKVIGWSSLSEYSDRCAYSDTAELSVYVKAKFRGSEIDWPSKTYKSLGCELEQYLEQAHCGPLMEEARKEVGRS